MKKLIAIILTALMLMSLCSCAEKGQVSEADEVVLPSEIVHEDTYLNDEYCGHYKTVTAYAEDGSVMWTYRSENSCVSQCETLEYLGMYNGIVYINEQALYDASKFADENFETQGHLRALNAATGEVLWDNTDYKGSGSVWSLDEKGNIYIGGYFGPACVKISKEGETVWTVDSADSDAYWMYGLVYKDGKITLSYEMNDDFEEETVILSAENGEIIG